MISDARPGGAAAPAHPTRRWTAARIPALLAILALMLYLPGFWWGAPTATGPGRIHGWAVDDETPLGPLAQVNNILHPQEIQNLGYPLMHSFMVVGAYAPYLGWLRLSGAWAGPQGGEYPYGFQDPIAALRGLSRIGHFVSVLLGVVVVLGAWWAAAAMWGASAGLFAALVTMTTYPMFYYSRTGNVDVPMMAFTAIALAAYAAAIRRPPSARIAILLGAAAGFAMATKEQTIGVFLAIAPVLLVLHLGRTRPGERWRLPAWKLPGLTLLAVVVAFGLGSGLFVDPTRFFAHLDFIQGRLELVREGEIAFVPRPDRSLEGSLELLKVLGGFAAQVLSLPGLLIGGAGIALAVWRDRRAALLALPALSYLTLLFLAARTGQLRYLLPATFVIGLFAGWVLSLAWAARNRGVRLVGRLATVWVLGLGLLRGVDLTWAMLRDSRYEAATWIAARAAPADRLEYFGPAYKLPALPATLDAAQAVPHRGPLVAERRDAAAAAEIAAGWQARRPRFILVVPDWSSEDGEPHPASLPPSTFAALTDGSLGYRLATTFETPALMPWIRRPPLDYPLVNPPVRVFVRDGDALR